MALPLTPVMNTPALDSDNWHPWAESLKVSITELQQGGVSEQSVGFLNAADPKWGLKKWDPAAPWDNDASALFAAAHTEKKAIVAPAIYKLKNVATGDCNFDDRNMDLISVGGGGFIGEGNTIVRQVIAPSPHIALTGISTKAVGNSNRHGVSFFDVDKADIPKFQAEMAWQIVATGAKKSEIATAGDGFYSWSHPGSVVQDLLQSGDTPKASGKVVMAEAFIVLGVSYLVSGASDTLAENDILKGQTSGATMKLEYAGEDQNGSVNARVSTRKVLPGTSGSFQVGENLLRGTTVVGKIAAAGQVASKSQLFYDWNKVTVAKVLRKLGGSQRGYTNITPLFPVGDWGTNLISRTRELTFDTVNDPNGVDQTRGAAIDIRGAVYGKYIGDVFKNGYRNGYRIASGVGGTISGSITEALPNDATTEGGFGYHVEVEGTTQWFAVLGCVSHNVRHGFTTNPRGNSAYLSAVGDTLAHGIQRFVFVIGHTTFNTYGPGLDTHHGCDNIFFISCTVTGIITLGEKDSDGSAAQTRGSNVWFIHVTTHGGRYGFNDATAGFTVPQGNPKPGTTWTLDPIHSRTHYLFCQAFDYDEVGFRQGLAAESVHHSVLYVSPIMGASKTARYKTVGMRLTGVDTWVIDPVFGYNTLAQVDILPGAYWKLKDKTFIKPASPIPFSIGFLGTGLADFSQSPAGVKMIRVAGSPTEGVMKLVLPGDLDVIQKASAPTTPDSWVDPQSGRVTIKGRGEIRNLTGDTAIPLLKKDYAGTVTKKTLPTSSWVS